MYLAGDPGQYHQKYFNLVREIQEAAPSTTFMFMVINEKIIQGHYYKALRQAKELMKLEDELIHDATNRQQKAAE